jgi:glycosyltransferase involved in cell wall biosynthesis
MGRRPMRIAYITETYPPEINGVALTVQRTVQHLRRRGHVVELVRPHQPHDAADDGGPQAASQWLTAGLPIPMYPDLRFGLARAATLRRRWHAQGAAGPQLVHVATPGPLGRAAVLAARTARLPVTTDFRTRFHQYSRHYGLGWLAGSIQAYLRNLHNRSQATFVPTRALRDELAAQGFQRVEVVARGVDTALFTPARRRAALRAAWGAADSAPVLLYVGRLAAEKNVRLALRAFTAVCQAQPQARMVVVGDGPQRRRLQAEFAQVHFAGAQRGEALAEHYASADVFLFPSESETFGNVTLEALASGLAVVAFDCAAAAECIRHGHSGWLVPPGDPGSFIAQAWRTAGGAGLAPGTPLREQARAVALAAGWDAVLQRFEQRLAAVAADHAAAGTCHVAVA